MNSYQLNDLSKLELFNLNAELVAYRGRLALQLVERDATSEEQCIAIIKDSAFKNGVIETEIAGIPKADAFEGARGFVGIAFRVQPQGKQFEYFFIRPTNGRADDQLRAIIPRNIVRIPIIRGSGCERKARVFMSRIPISLSANGRGSRSSLQDSARSCMSMVRINRV